MELPPGWGTRRSPPRGGSHTATAANDRGWSSSSRVWMCPLQGSWSKGRAGCGPRGTWRSVCGIGGHECPRGKEGVRDSEREPSGSPIRVKPRMGGQPARGGREQRIPAARHTTYPGGTATDVKKSGLGCCQVGGAAWVCPVPPMPLPHCQFFFVLFFSWQWFGPARRGKGGR